MDETKFDPKTLFDNSEEWVALTKEELEEWANKKYPWYQELWWAIRRIPNRIDFILTPKYKLEKEHKEIGLGYWDRPVKKYDTWNLSNHMAWVIYPKLVRFKRSERHGVPGFYEDRGITFEEEIAAWEVDLDKMIYSFQEIVYDETPDFKTSEEIEAYHNRIQEGLDLFGKYYRGLWD